MAARCEAIPIPLSPAPAAAVTRVCSAMLFGAAGMLAAYLAWSAWRGGAVAGCGAESGCDRVLQSRWAHWLGVPVSVPAAGLYFALAVLAGRGRAANALAALSALVLLAAAWFVLLQAFVLHAWCALCLTTHLTASAGAAMAWWSAPARRGRVPVVVALAGVAVLMAGQLFSSRSTHRVSALPVSAGSLPVAAGISRTLSLHEGQFQLDLQACPSVGVESAPQVVVSLFDYTCSHCQEMHGVLEQTRRELGERLRIVLLPVPLDARCNRLVGRTSAENAGACDYARLALAVWLARPEAFPAFHAALFAATRPTLDAARVEAERLVGGDALRAALSDERITRLLRQGVELFAVNNRRAGAAQLPQLMLKSSVSVGPVQDVATLRAMIQEDFSADR